MSSGEKKTAENVTVFQIHVRMMPELRELIQQEADAEYPLTMNDVIVRTLAKHYKRHDLRLAPKKRMGRPRKQPA